MSIKSSNDTNRNQTHNPPAYSAVSQPTALLRDTSCSSSKAVCLHLPRCVESVSQCTKLSNICIVFVWPTFYYTCMYVHNFNQNLKHYALVIPQHLCFYCDLFYCCMSEWILVSAPWGWRDNSAETCRSYVKDCKLKLYTSAFVGGTWIIYFDKTHGITM